MNLLEGVVATDGQVSVGGYTVPVGRYHPQKGETLYVTTDPQHVHVRHRHRGAAL